MPTTFLRPILILLFLRLSFAALEDKLNGAEIIDFASTWNNLDAFGMLPPGMQACRPDLLSWQDTASLRSYPSWGILETLLGPCLLSKLLLPWPPDSLALAGRGRFGGLFKMLPKISKCCLVYCRSSPLGWLLPA